MHVYRIVSPKYASHVLSGEGSSRFPGRWNTKGHSAIYASLSSEVALEEFSYYAVPDARTMPSVLAEISIPDTVSRESVDPDDLPDGWSGRQSYQTDESAPSATQQIGTNWLERKSTCMLIVPSAIVEDGFNCLLNPVHKDFSKSTIAIPKLDGQHEIATNDLRSPVKKDYADVFICHASEDKTTVVEPLLRGFDSAGISYWYDRKQIKWGDSVIGKVNEGLKRCRFVIVVLSRSFLRKEWPRREWHSALNWEISLGRTFVLPLLVGNDEERERIIEELILENDKAYIVWEGNAEPVIGTLAEVLTRSE